MYDPLISIIIPIYNVANYLDTCIKTALRQTYENIEIILVDDGSHDESPLICDRWAMKDSRIIVIHKKNGGPSDARNVGLSVAKGEYVYFLDGDDYVAPNLIETILPYMRSGADMVVFGHREVWPDGRDVCVSRPDKTYLLKTSDERAEFILGDFLGYKLGWEPWNRIFRRDIIEKYHIFFEDHRLVFSEDLFFCLCYCAHIEKIVSIPRSLYYYMQRSESTMGKNGRKVILNEMNELGKSVEKHFKQYEDCMELLSYFPVIHYLIINNVIQHVLRCKSCTVKELRKYVFEEIWDQDYFWKNAHAFIKRKELVRRIKGERISAECFSLCKYLFDGSYTKLRIRNYIIRKFPSNFFRMLYGFINGDIH